MLDAPLTDRKRDVLKAIISDYIFTAEPVSSGTITSRYIEGLSSATVRNIMADLEEMGLLYQPHTSAGRIPTEKGFRVYVDHLMQPKPLPAREREEIRKACDHSRLEVVDFVRGVSRHLSALSHHTGLAIVSKSVDTVLKHIEFVKLGRNRALVVMVSQGGIVQNKLIELDEAIHQSELDRMSGYLNELFSGLAISEIKRRLLKEMEREKVLYDRMLRRALKLGKELLVRTDSETREVFIEGQSRFFEYPEFLDMERMREMFRAFEEKSRIISLLDKSLRAKGVHIFIGCETGSTGLRGCSLITAPYKINENTLGSIGVIGPVRMDYAHIIPLVEYTATVVGRTLKEG